MSAPSLSGLHDRWSTPIGVHVWSQAAQHHDTLIRVLKMMRWQDPKADAEAAFYASPDDLLNRIRIPEWTDLVRFLIDGVSRTVAHANQAQWGAQHPAFQIALRGLWCQMSNRAAHHDVHTHGNCSWSGVYCLQVDPSPRRESHAVFGARNGVTRFYGPYANLLAGAHNDFGNAYLQNNVWDIDPIPGQLVVFPSWLAHQAMPYEGEQDRIILSFNVSVHAASGRDETHAYANA